MESEMTIHVPSRMWLDEGRVWLLRCPTCELFYGAKKKRIYCTRKCQNKAFYNRNKEWEK